MDVSGIISALFSSPILYIITLVVVLVLIFTGKIRIKGNVLSVNASDGERSIIRQQVEFAASAIKGLLRKFPEDENRYRQLYILEMLYNCCVSAISYNHLATTPEYVKVKQSTLWDIASTTVDDPMYQTDEFKKLIYESTEQLIHDLCEIRKLGEKSYYK